MRSTILLLLTLLGLTAAPAAELVALALVRDSDGLVATLIRPDVPAGYTAPEGFHLVPADQLPPGWQLIPPTIEEIAVKTKHTKRDAIRSKLALATAQIANLEAGTGTTAVRLARLEALMAAQIEFDRWVIKQLLLDDGIFAEELESAAIAVPDKTRAIVATAP